MNEIVFFNPADSIGNFHDYNEAIKSAQIYKEKNNNEAKSVLVVKGVNKPEFEIFLADDVVNDTNTTNGEAYKINERF
ncbi:hypothetical protein FC56_GL000698 [Lentilactobacillus senioris DSM 24302 = JCM 17472]|uniref:Uncharacterized protein n=1 Tax=Lentilactobacillus senioris DSM 24302 = JCM 17472 TaxID=1423802 RepID=A0A0R2D0L9_9LACO|nr:hypothetical protein [Lentilactobacillus senioris]KRM93977.1 hypothetical protein FC56_GL000698 [Lentilactobacillus senioris DSM 24302 = JCM 17472]MCY9806987.1 hypothetical protein [Lentilactobacillus senioris]